MDWKENTVSMGLTNEEEFELTLATITVSDRRILVEPNDVEDWGHIFEELGTDIVLEEVHWDEIEDVSVTVRDLYYPHINVRFKQSPGGEDGDLGLVKERHIFFLEDEKEELMECLHAIRKYWSKWRQNKALEDERFQNEIDEDEEREEVELMDALRENHEARETDEQESTEPQIREEDTEDDAAEQLVVEEHEDSQNSDTHDGEEQDDETLEDTIEIGTKELEIEEIENAAKDKEERTDEAADESEEDEEKEGDEGDELDDIVDGFLDQ